MSRALRLIAQYFAQAWDGEISTKSIRLSNESAAEPTEYCTKISVKFEGGVFDKSLYSSLISTGFFLDDKVQLHLADGECRKISQVSQDQLEINVVGLTFILTKEAGPISPGQVIDVLRKETFFGLPELLFHNLRVSDVHVFFGANQQPLQLSQHLQTRLRAYDGLSFALKDTHTGEVRLRYLDEVGRLQSKSSSVLLYLDADLKNQVFRHAFTPKTGLDIYTAKIGSQYLGDTILDDWILLRSLVQTKVATELQEHTSAQVTRITNRLHRVNQREWLMYGRQHVFLKPNNEVETVLLFQKITHAFPQMLPAGMKVEILDYSPKDIDSICKFQPSPNHPQEIVPVEFEFELRSFFKHGHDHRQVKLLICFTVSPMSFPYSYGGVEYRLLRDAAIPRLENSFDHCSIPCLILEELFS